MFHHVLDILTIYFKISGNLKKAFVKKTMKFRIAKILLLLCLFTSCSSVQPCVVGLLAMAAMMQSCRSVQPSCSSGWRATKDELTKDMVKPSLFYRPADEIASAIHGVILDWANEADEAADNRSGTPDSGAGVEELP